MEGEVCPTWGWGTWEVLGEVTAEGEACTLESSPKALCKVNDPYLIYPRGKMNFPITVTWIYLYNGAAAQILSFC